MSEIKVTTEQLWKNAQEIGSIAGDFSHLIVKNRQAFNKYRESCSAFCSWSFTTVSNQIEGKFVNIMETLTQGCKTAMNCVLAYEEANTELINSYSGWFDGDVEVTTIGGDHEAWVEDQIRKEEQKRAEELRGLIGQSTYCNPAYEDDVNRMFYGKGQCTGYAYSRFKTIYPKADLGLGAQSGNAGDWVANNEGRNHIETCKGGWDSLDTDRLPCIAESSGHVYIVEGVIRNENGEITQIVISESNGYNRQLAIASDDETFTEGVDGVYDLATPESLSVNGFIYYAP